MRALLYLGLCFVVLSASAEDTWQDALSKMPLGTNAAELNRSNCVKIMLPALQSNDVVKALIFMPGATDEFYMFHRAKASLTNASPTLLDAVNALTNQTYIRATFEPPMLLLHTDEDPLDFVMAIADRPTANRIAAKQFMPHAVFDDRDYDYLLPILEEKLQVKCLPGLYSYDSFHFYRHSFAAWNLNGWEALEAVAMAGKTKFTISTNEVIFEGDARTRAQPKLDGYHVGN